MPDRSGSASAAIGRLIYDIEPTEVQRVLSRFLNGTLTPSSALIRMVLLLGDAAALRTAVDIVTERGASLSRSGDKLLRDRVDDLTQHFVESERSCESVALRIGARAPKKKP